MKHRFLILGFCCLLTAVASGQWLESTIYLLDSGYVTSSCYCPTNNSVYFVLRVPHYPSGVIRISGTTIVDTIPVSNAYGICYVASTNEVCCSSYDYGGGTVSVIDCSTNTVVDTITVGSQAGNLLYNPLNDLVYGSRTYSELLFVIDPQTREVIATMPSPGYPSGFSLDSADNKLYVCDVRGESVTVVDCGLNEVVRTLHVGPYPEGSCYNPLRGKVYVSAGSTVAVIDCATDSVVATIPTGIFSSWTCCNLRTGDVYCGNAENGGEVCIIDGAGDSVRLRLPVRIPRVWYNPLNDKIYCGADDRDTVTVIDGRNDSIIKRVAVVGPSLPGGWNPASNQVYFIGYRSSTINVLRDSLPEGVGEMTTAEMRATNSGPTVLSGASSVKQLAFSVIFDAMGRRVSSPKSGIYFVLEAKAQTIRKVIVQH